MYCMECGSKLSESGTYCPVCGTDSRAQETKTSSFVAIAETKQERQMRILLTAGALVICTLFLFSIHILYDPEQVFKRAVNQDNFETAQSAYESMTKSEQEKMDNWLAQNKIKW